jgi:hypothetical protein
VVDGADHWSVGSGGIGVNGAGAAITVAPSALATSSIAAGVAAFSLMSPSNAVTAKPKPADLMEKMRLMDVISVEQKEKEL